MFSGQDDRVEFVMIAEAGILEAQAVLLCDSIRAFAGAYLSSPITVISPRSARRPSSATLRRLEALQAEYLPLEIDSCCPQYGTSFRIHGLAHVERRSGPPVVVQLDSDAIFVAEPDLSMTGSDAVARPVDVKGMCTTGPGDPFDPYWRELCALVGVDYEHVPVIESTVDRQAVRASYNGGFVAVRRASGIFERTEVFFRKLVAARMMPWTADGPVVNAGTGVLSGAATAYWGTSQAALSLAAVAGHHIVRLWPGTHNFPLHLLDHLAAPIPTPLVHIHYHGSFSTGAGYAYPALEARLNLPEQVAEWLRLRLPLSP